ncbi:MATE family efflux transporter [Anaerocolumna cellulosilytica]|uniref:MATE family efflux transporter n=1 Tax=Anaerocolumna cellulosilytica TaxID=433286 RepID=A0A6S6QZK5_9FIRM|nr:MATE family efflux transporter [Anaerocolumna cellulosilytica]MBB5194343.1 putative MATE family efflux protein [Anaerocolumna cellulosilytica]BCJ93287.1 MATE family efflux transporter [Anaerocolumna cellulosilytica]
MNINEKMERKQFYKLVLSLVIPMALQNLINVGVTSADVIMLGKVGETVLSASSLAGQVQFIMTLIFFGLTSGAAVLTAQYWGKKDIRTIEKVLGITMRFALIVGIFFTAVVLVFPAQIMRIFTSEEPVIREGVDYLRIIAFSYIFIAITMIYLNIMRSVERVIISTLVYLVSLIINIIFNAIFIFGLFGLEPMGIKGAALATLIARIVEFLIVLFYSKKINKEVQFRFKNLLVRDKLLMKDFLEYSLPVVVNELMWGAGTAANAAIIGHLGQSVVAANSVTQVTRQLATVIAFGLANATAIILGKAIGEQKEELAKIYAKRLIRLTLILGVIGAIVVQGVSHIAKANMNLSAEANSYLGIMMFVMSYFVIGQVYNTTMIVGVFRAGGDTRFGLVLDVITLWGCSILLGFIAAFILKWSIPIVYIIIMSDEIIKIPLSTWRYKSMKWLRNVTR